SRAHTAVKVDQQYDGPVVWVKDASRSVPVVSQLLSRTGKEPLLAEVGADYEALRKRHAAKNKDRPMLTHEEAQEARTPIDWGEEQAHLAGASPTRVVFEDYDLAELREYFDWQPFFNAWELKGSFPDILNSPGSGEVARKLYDEAQVMLDRIIEEKWLTAKGVIGLFPANAVGDDIEIYTDESRSDVAHTLHMLLEQGKHRPGVPNRSLADSIAPRETVLTDYIAAFAVTGVLAAADKIAELKAENDDYNAILLAALADRFAAAFAERLHERVGREHWGYAPNEDPDNEALIKERYDGIRPAP